MRSHVYPVDPWTDVLDQSAVKPGRRYAHDLRSWEGPRLQVAGTGRRGCRRQPKSDGNHDNGKSADHYARVYAGNAGF
jgi:hypothetical protein